MHNSAELRPMQLPTPFPVNYFMVGILGHVSISCGSILRRWQGQIKQSSKCLIKGQSIDVSSTDPRCWSKIIMGKTNWLQEPCVLRKLGPVTFHVDVGHEQVWKRIWISFGTKVVKFSSLLPPLLVLLIPQATVMIFVLLSKMLHRLREMLHAVRTHDKILHPIKTYNSPGGEQAYQRKERHPPECYRRPICW